MLSYTEKKNMKFKLKKEIHKKINKINGNGVKCRSRKCVGEI